MSKINSLTRLMALKARYPLSEIETAYNRQFQRWLHQNSHEQEPIPEADDGVRRYEFDDKGFITNTSFSGKTRSGFNLLEQDFINIELRRVNYVNIDSLDLDGQKYIEFLKAFFENKNPQETKETGTKIDKVQNQKTLYHVISYVLECHANNKPLPIGNKASIEKDAKERLKYSGALNTFYKNFNKIAHEDLTRLHLNKSIGNNWQSIVLGLANNPETLKDYLKRHYK